MNNFLQFEWKKWAIVEKWVKMKDCNWQSTLTKWVWQDDNGESRDVFIMAIHPDRRQLSDELHARPFHDF